MIYDETVQPGPPGTVRIIPGPTRVVVPAPEAKPAPAPVSKSRKSKSGETRYLEPVEPAEIPAERTAEGNIIVRKALPVDDETERQVRERVTTTEEKRAPVKTSRSSSSKKEPVQASRKKVSQPDRDEEETKVKTEVSSKQRDGEVVSEPPKRQVVEESTPTTVARTTNPLMPNPASTEERKPLDPAELPAPRQETTVTKEVTTSREAPSVQQTPPEQQTQPVPPVPQVEEKVSSTPPPEIPKLTAPSDYPSATANSEIAPANLPSGTIEKTGSKKNSADVPVAEKTDKPGFVNTPFTPKKLIDVRGMAPGSLAKDPSTNKVFRVP
jgi:hypothetical protein